MLPYLIDLPFVLLLFKAIARQHSDSTHYEKEKKNSLEEDLGMLNAMKSYCNTTGSHFKDKFFSSTTVTERAKPLLIWYNLIDAALLYFIILYVPMSNTHSNHITR